MSMSTHVVGFKPADAKWKQMKAVYDSCQEAGIESPEVVEEFFGGNEPDELGVEVEEEQLLNCGAITEWGADSRNGFELHIDKLPKDIKIVRFYNAY